MKTDFTTKSKELSRYALSCGYVQREQTDMRWRELYMEHSHYHVRGGKVGDQFDKWEVFSDTELTKARKLFKKLPLA